jgi:hypothetical protein
MSEQDWDMRLPLCRIWMLLLMAGFAVSPNLAAEEASPEGAAFMLPAKGERVSLAEIKTICEHFGLMKLWAKIEADPPGKPFASDGCTSWVDKVKGRSIYPACFLHDLKYWAGYPGEKVERLAADAELMIDVARILESTAMAETMYAGVRVGGSEHLKAKFSWGFGRQRE